MSDKARYGISLAIGWSIGAVFLASISGTEHWGEPWTSPVAAVLTFGVTLAALVILRGE